MRELDEKSAEGGYSAANSMEHKEFSVRRGSVFPQAGPAVFEKRRVLSYLSDTDFRGMQLQ